MGLLQHVRVASYNFTLRILKMNTMERKLVKHNKLYCNLMNVKIKYRPSQITPISQSQHVLFYSVPSKFKNSVCLVMFDHD